MKDKTVVGKIIDLKKNFFLLMLGMQTQLNSMNNMGWVPSGHTSSSLCVRLKMFKHFWTMCAEKLPVGFSLVFIKY